MKTVTYHTFEKRSDYVDMIPPSQEAWDWLTNANGDIHIFEDTSLPEHTKFDGKIKVASLNETPAVYDYVCGKNPSVFHPYRWFEQNHQHFQVVLSPFNQLRDLVGDRYWWVPSCGNRIRPEDFGLYEKERLISIVASNKQWTVGHKLRHQVVQRYPTKMDTYGSGYNDIIDKYDDKRLGKVLAVAPYYYSFAIMNSKFDDYFTEILTDVLACGTIPIWWGTANVGKYFNPDGIVQFNTIEELDALLPTLTPELYRSKVEAVKENIEKAKAYNTRYDWLYANYKAKLEAL
jgi:hypothetical protein